MLGSPHQEINLGYQGGHHRHRQLLPGEQLLCENLVADLRQDWKVQLQPHEGHHHADVGTQLSTHH